MYYLRDCGGIDRGQSVCLPLLEMNYKKLKRLAIPTLGAIQRRAKRGISIFRRAFGVSRRQIRRGPLLLKRGEVYYVPLWLPIALAVLLASTVIWDDIVVVVRQVSATAVEFVQRRDRSELAEFFAPSVRHWAGEIKAWASRYEVDRDLLATVMQIESCGHPSVVSVAGARGLFQVMPFHFSEGEDMLDPDTNARRGATYLNYCHRAADAVVGLTLACYNGGPAVLSQQRENWPQETQKYHRWGVGIYSDASSGKQRSETLDKWLDAGGSRLCERALAELRRSDRQNTPASS